VPLNYLVHVKIDSGAQPQADAKSVNIARLKRHPAFSIFGATIVQQINIL
jgi:hypothetical protein